MGEEQRDDELMDYLRNDVTHLKVQNEILRRQSDKWATVGICGFIATIICVLGFCATVFLLAREQSKQIATIFTNEWEMGVTYKGEDDSQNMSVQDNNGATISNLSQTQNVTKEDK